MISIMTERLGEHETQRDILERALGIMEAEFGANSHKAGVLMGMMWVCFLWIYLDRDASYNAIGYRSVRSIQFSVYINTQ